MRAAWAAAAEAVGITEVPAGDYPSIDDHRWREATQGSLSEYLRAVQRGEVVVVTKRNQVVAELKPLRINRELPEDVPEALGALAAAGEVTRAATKKKRWRWTAKGLGLGPGTVASILDDLRAPDQGH